MTTRQAYSSARNTLGLQSGYLRDAEETLQAIYFSQHWDAGIIISSFTDQAPRSHVTYLKLQPEKGRTGI